MKVFINAIIVHTLLNVYVFWKGWKAIPSQKKYRIPFVGIFALELIVYLVGFIFNDKLPIDILRPIMLIGTSWMVFILYMTLALLAYDIINFCTRWLKFIPRLIDLKSAKNKSKYYVTAIVFVLAIMLYGNYKFWHPTVNEVDIVVNKKTNSKNLRVAVVTDVHLGYLINRKILSMYVDKILDQNPDLILLVGDIIDYDLFPLEYEHMEQELARLKAPYGVFLSTGNHEYRENAEDKIKWLGTNTGITVLRDSVVKIADSFYIIGREDDEYKPRKQLSELMKNLDTKYPIIVMNHEPKRLYEETNAKVDIAVFGHTHDGQLFPANIISSIIYEVSQGYKKTENTNIYVSSGLGLSGPQYRIGTISELPILNIQFKSDN